MLAFIASIIGRQDSATSCAGEEGEETMPTFNMLPVDDAGMERVDEFLGLYRADRIPEGQWQDEMNLTADHYPMFAVRKKRSTVGGLPDGAEMIDVIRKGDALIIAYVPDPEETVFTLQIQGSTVEPLDIDYRDEAHYPYQMVSFGAYLIVLGANVWLKADQWMSGEEAEWGYIDYSETISSDVALYPCDTDGNAIEISYYYDPDDGEDHSGDTYTVGEYAADDATKTVKKYVANGDGTGGHWEKVTTYTLLLFSFSRDEIQPNDYLVFDSGSVDIGLTRASVVKLVDVPEFTEGYYYAVLDAYRSTWQLEHFTAESPLKIVRDVPDMDWVVEAQNRLWGCKYGYVDGELVNEIYASELGSFRNWRNYSGLANASYAASVGTDGKWTGAITYNSSPLFFKENCMHKVSVSASGAHQIVSYTMPGVQDGSGRSLCNVDGILYYKGVRGVYAYDGSMPVMISEALGDVQYDRASAGGANGKLYMAMRDDEGEHRLFCYSIKRGIWHQESTSDYFTRHIVPCGNSIYQIKVHEYLDLLGNDGTASETVEWYAVSGLIGYAQIEQKYVSRFDLRLMLPEGSTMDVYVEYDSDGVWHHQGHMVGRGTGSFTLPVRPRRCDHFRIKLSGSGDMKMYSFAKMLQRGSDYV